MGKRDGGMRQDDGEREALQKEKGLLQFLKFAVVGLSNTVIGFGFYYAFLFLGCHYMIANVLSWGISVFNGFYWNHKYVFQGAQSWLGSLLKTYASYGISFIAGAALLYVLVEWMALSELWAPWFTLGLTVPLNFVLNKFWAFR